MKAYPNQSIKGIHLHYLTAFMFYFDLSLNWRNFAILIFQFFTIL